MSPLVRATPETVEEAARILRAGGLVAFPTETVYGLGAVATNDAAVARLFAAKGRPAHNPLIVHVADAAGARPLARWNERADALAEAFWPGPLTLVLPQASGSPISPLVTAGLGTIAVRAPAAPTAQALLDATLLPIAAPSANRSGCVSPTTAAHVAAELGEAVDLTLDAGACAVGVESTVIDLSDAAPRLLRPGGVTRAQVEAIVGPLGAGAPGKIMAPGQLASHYAPTRPVRLDAKAPVAGEAYLAFGPEPDAQGPLLNLSASGDLGEAAHNLFAMLRALDRADVTAIAVAPIPDESLGEALNDRLRRAAAIE